MANLEVQTFKSINEIDPEIWDRVVANRGFQSHNWYKFGERAMAECQPTYLVVWDGDKPVASAALFRIHNEPLPLPSVARRFMASVLKRRPLLVCRSPLADTSAMLLPGEPLRDEALAIIAKAAQQLDELGGLDRRTKSTHEFNQITEQSVCAAESTQQLDQFRYIQDITVLVVTNSERYLR